MQTIPQPIQVAIHRLAHAPKHLPAYATPGSAGMDVQAAIGVPLTLQPLERTLVPTGFIMMLPEGYECQVRARSGLAIKHGICLANGVGTIDSDYRHEVKVALINLSSEAFTIQPGDRIAQLVIAPVTQVRWTEAEDVVLVEGRQGGFGSTGIAAPEPA
ncbi:dUTP diphosphatase [Vampirovibrio chlorellavorus]|uniref:dUTP diphosphatase n=1 Tax=Vampirovibrio chlorellavorus TaxID=758823 RepID=UPI0026EBA7E5|nr:dUTP diphosphatase [Vampirovibrio chlorellavorus]